MDSFYQVCRILGVVYLGDESPSAENSLASRISTKTGVLANTASVK